MWYIPEYNHPFHTEESACEAAIETAKRRDEKVDMVYMEYDADAGSDRVVSWAYPCGCVENAPNYRRLRDFVMKCNEHGDK